MNTEFTLFDRQLTLIRYPAKHQHKSLQAWDSADELVIEHLLTEQCVPDAQPWIIMNDDFGSLATFFAGQNATTAVPTWVSDSTIARLSLAENLQVNHCKQVDVVDCLASLPIAPALVVIKVPRTLALLEHQLIQLRSVVSAQTHIVAAAKVKAVTRGVLDLFEKYLGPTRTSLAKKKSRLIFCEADSNKLNTPVSSPYPTRWQCTLATGQAVSVSNHANVFSRQSLDIGARLLLEHMTVADHDHVVDLGCGNGVLGLNALSLAPACKVTFVDESLMAVESAKDNVANNFQDQVEQCEFVASNCLESLLDRPYRPLVTKVFCNPPFHQQNAITDHIAWQMFHDAYELLNKGGHLIVVANRHLDYYPKLKRLFGGVNTIANDRKFVIYSAAKR